MTHVLELYLLCHLLEPNFAQSLEVFYSFISKIKRIWSSKHRSIHHWVHVSLKMALSTGESKQTSKGSSNNNTFDRV